MYIHIEHNCIISQCLSLHKNATVEIKEKSVHCINTYVRVC